MPGGSYSVGTKSSTSPSLGSHVRSPNRPGHLQEMWPCQRFRTILLPVLRPDIKLGTGSNRNRGLQNRPLSALIRNLGNPPYLALESFENRPRFPFFFPFDQSPDRALNHNIRLSSEPDRKFSLEKEEGIRAEHLVTRERSLRGLPRSLLPKAYQKQVVPRVLPATAREGN